MSQELIYTSAKKGMRPGSRGFCTVACTPGMPKNLADYLESLSGYKHVYAPQSEQAHLNPINHSYLRFKLAGVEYFLLSRIANGGLDYTQRSNKIAHHIVLTREELPDAGPSRLMSAGQLFVDGWDQPPENLKPRRMPQVQGEESRECRAWRAATGDAGWAAELAASAVGDAMRKANVIYPPGADALALFDEALRLLPSSRVWSVTYSTYFSTLPPGVECHWCGYVDGTAEAESARRKHGELVIDLVNLAGEPTAGDLAELARTGVASRSAPDPRTTPGVQHAPPPQQPGGRLEVETREQHAQAPPRLPPQPELINTRGWVTRQRQRGGQRLLPLLVAGALVAVAFGVGIGAYLFSGGAVAHRGEKERPHTQENYSTADREEQTHPSEDPVPAPGPHELAVTTAQEAEIPRSEELAEQHTPSPSQDGLPESDEMTPFPEPEGEPVAREAVGEAPDPFAPGAAAPGTLPAEPISNKPEPRVAPEDLFTGLRRLIALPPIPATGTTDDTAFMEPVSLGEFESGQHTVTLRVLQPDRSQYPLKLTRDPEKHLTWMVSTDASGIEVDLASIRYAGGELKMRWGQDARRAGARPERILRSSFLEFDQETPGHARLVTLQPPESIDLPVRLSPDLKEVTLGMDARAALTNANPFRSQSIKVRGEARGLPLVDADLSVSLRDCAFELPDDGGVWEWAWPIDHDESLRLVLRYNKDAPQTISARPEYKNSKGRYVPFEISVLEETLSLRRNLLDKASGVLVEHIWSSGTKLLTDEARARYLRAGQLLKSDEDRSLGEKERLMRVLEAYRQTGYPGYEAFRKRTELVFTREARAARPAEDDEDLAHLLWLEEYLQWLLRADWEFSESDWKSIAQEPCYHELLMRRDFYRETGSARKTTKYVSAFKRLNAHAQQNPAAQLRAWRLAADALPQAEVHFRVTRQLAAADAGGLSPPPSADILVVGAPPEVGDD